MKNIQNTEEGYWQKMLITALIVIGTIALIVWAMPRDKETNFKVERGKPWRYADFTAPFDFPIYKSDELIKKERDSLTKTFEPYYNYNPSTGTNLIKQFKQDYPNGIPGIPAGSIEVITSHLQQLYEQGIMNSSEHNKLRKDTTKFIRIVNGKRATTVSVNNIYSTVGAYEKLFADPVLAANREQLAKCNLNDYIMANLTYDKERSEAGLEDIISSIPLANGVVQRGEKIIDRGGIIDDHSYDILESYFRESKRRQKDDVQLSYIILGEIIYVGILIICFTIYDNHIKCS